MHSFLQSESVNNMVCAIETRPLIKDPPPELLKAADVRLRQICQKLRKFLPFERKSGENDPNFVFFAQSDNVFF